MSTDFKDTFNFIKNTVDKKEEFQRSLYVVPKTELVNKFLSSASNNHTVDEFLSETKEKYTFEIGGKNKDFSQIKDIKNSYVASDGIEVGFKNKIPLWIFGFLY